MNRPLKIRVALLSIVLLQLIIIVVALAHFGISYVNIDSLQDHPVQFCLLFIIPFWLGLVTLILALLPRLQQIQFLLFIGLWLTAELVFGLINIGTPELIGEGEPQSLNQTDYYTEDPVLGYKVVPNNTARHVESYGTQKLYDVIYRIDGLGRRVTPIDSPGLRTKLLLFFGDSNAFGDGVTQEQTLAYWAGKFAPDYRPYNYALSGYGPAQMLDLIKTRPLDKEVSERQGFAFYYFIQDHIARVIGSSQVSTDWGIHFSRYVLNSGGQLVREGDFATGRPFLTLFYACVEASNIVKYFRLRLPIRYSEADYQLAAEIIAESRRRLDKEFELKNFYVIIAPVFNEQELAISERFMVHLKKVGVPFLDFTHLYDANEPQYTVAEEDAHNSGLADRLIAAEIVRELGIGDATIH